MTALATHRSPGLRETARRTEASWNDMDLPRKPKDSSNRPSKRKPRLGNHTAPCQTKTTTPFAVKSEPESAGGQPGPLRIRHGPRSRGCDSYCLRAVFPTLPDPKTVPSFSSKWKQYLVCSRGLTLHRTCYDDGVKLGKELTSPLRANPL